jgi:hypothetical protein
MKEITKCSPDQVKDPSNTVKSWIMIILTISFTLLYAAALLGWLKPLTDERMVTHLEPIIFVIIGYYFGRLPAQQNEKTLKDEISRQIHKADAAQYAKEQTQQACEALEEKIKNVRTTLVYSTTTASSAMGKASKSATDNLSQNGGAAKDEALRLAVTAALNILDS